MSVNPFNLQAIGAEIIGADEIIGGEIVGADEPSLSQLLGVLGDDDDDDEVGDDDDDIDIGAVKRYVKKAKAKKKMNRLMITLKLATGGLMNAQTQNSQGRFLTAGGRATQGGTAGALDVVVTVQETFRPQRLTIQAVDNTGAAVSLATIEITDILCGTRSQLTSLGGVPASMYGAEAVNQFAGNMFDTLQAGTSFVVRFRSIAANVTVTVGIAGAAMR